MTHYDRTPRATIRSVGNMRKVRYSIHVHVEDVEFYTIRRTHPHAAIEECWGGRELGWCPVAADYIGKRYARYGDATRTLAKLQDMDREALTAAGRKRHLERLAPQLLAALEDTLGALNDASYACDPLQAAENAANLIRIAKRGY